MSDKANQPVTTAEFFGTRADEWTALYDAKRSFRDRMSLFLGTLHGSVPPPARVLDFGCGTGNIALALARMGYQVVGMDGSEGMLRVARANADRLGLNSAIFMSGEAPPVLEPESFDAIICSSVIEYVRDDLGLLLSLIRGLRSGGYLLISVPDAGSAVGRLEDLITRMRPKQKRRHMNYSLRRYRLARFKQTLEDMGMACRQSIRFELPMNVPGSVALSRIAGLGVMCLLSAKKNGVDITTGKGGLSAAWHATRNAASGLRNKQVWDTLPSSVRTVAGALLRARPLSRTLGMPFCENHHMALLGQWWSPEQVATFELARLQRVCMLAYRRSVYYQRVFRQAGFEPGDLKRPEDVRGLPLLGRDAVVRFGKEMLTGLATPMERLSTGGTSGKPLEFFISRDRSAFEYAHLVASWNRCGYELGMPMAVLRGQVVRRDRSGMHHAYDPLLRHHLYSSFHLTDEAMARYVRHMESLGPCYLHVYPSSLDTLARFLLRSGRPAPRNIRGIIAESEIVYPEQRQRAEQVFGCRYFSCYGQSEKVVMAAECEHCSDYHVWPTYGYFELIDEAGEPVTTPGQRGEIVGTSFVNTVMPFIRYRTGDYAIFVGNACAQCGRKHPVIRDIRGHRTQEMLVCSDGAQVCWTALNMHDDTFERVVRFQFYQDTAGVARLRVVPAAGFADEDRQRILRNLRHKLEQRLDITIEVVDSIPMSARGKAIYVDQRIDSVQSLA